MPSIWEKFEEIKEISTQYSNTYRLKANFELAKKEVKYETQVERVQILNIIINDINENNKFGIYEYYEKKNIIYIIMDYIKEKIDNLEIEISKIKNQSIILESVIDGHNEPMNKRDIDYLFSFGEKSMCKIYFYRSELEKGCGTGFFCKFNIQNFPFEKALITNNHVFKKSDISLGKMRYEYKNKKFDLDLSERRVYTNEDGDNLLDYTFIQILDIDNIQEFFNINDNDPIFTEKKNTYKGHEIIILQFPQGKELSFSLGTIKHIDNDHIFHNSSTKFGSSGSPIIIPKNNEYKVIGIHCSSHKQKTINIGITISKILNHIKNKLNGIHLRVYQIRNNMDYYLLTELENFGFKCPKCLSDELICPPENEEKQEYCIALIKGKRYIIGNPKKYPDPFKFEFDPKKCDEKGGISFRDIKCLKCKYHFFILHNDMILNDMMLMTLSNCSIY